MHRNDIVESQVFLGELCERVSNVCMRSKNKAREKREHFLS
jgi:hypothetical protein